MRARGAPIMGNQEAITNSASDVVIKYSYGQTSSVGWKQYAHKYTLELRGLDSDLTVAANTQSQLG